MRLTLTLRPAGAATPDRAVDVLVEAPGGTRVREIAAELTRAAGRPGAPLYAGSSPLDPELPLGQGPLRDGAVLGVGTTVPTTARRRGLVELRVVGGPDAGGVHPLPRGTAVLGRDPAATIRLADPDLSRRHAEVHTGPDGVHIRDGGSRNGTRLGGVPLGAEPRRCRPGALLRAGESTLTVAGPDDPPAAVQDGRAGTLILNRPPRLLPDRRPVTVTMPEEPAARAPSRIPVLGALLPLAGGVAMALLWHAPQFLIFTVLSPILLVANAVAERRGLRRGRRRELAEYREALAAAETELADAIAAEGIRRRHEHPDLARLWHAATGPGQLLWERRVQDPDALVLRIGLAALPGQVGLERGGRTLAAPVLPDVPATIDLRAHGVVGLAGPADPAAALVRGLLVQLATLHSPDEVSVTLLCSDRTAAGYSWSRWLPHLRSGTHLRVGLDACRRTHLIEELLREVERRAETTAADRPLMVVVLDRAATLRSQPGVPRLLAEGPAVGIYALCVETERRLLPGECGAVVEVTGEVGTRARLTRRGAAAVESIRLDGASTVLAEQISRALAPFRAGAGGGSGAPPTESSLPALLSRTRPRAEDISTAWTAAGRTTRTVIGESARGPLVIDLAKDGPHALIAGTTGAGKSELLQSIIAGLAVGNRPDAMTFVLIDYKGGAAFKDCAELPHTVGMVTDLDGHLTERALVSLTAELKHREQLFAAAGVKDIEDYWRQEGAPLPRLVLVIDEFASLVEELPDFVTGLVGIAMRGRSLGVHLILATQRPSGVVSPVIRANTNLRIALRVTDDGESRDVIDATDAARIPKDVPGRAFLRIGAETPVEFQTARVGGPAVIDAAESAVRPSPWLQAGDAAVAVPGGVEERQTGLQRLVGAIGAAARQDDLAAPRRPWLPPLPDRITLADLPVPPGEVVPFALSDHPHEQRRDLFALDLATGGSVAIVGGPRSGRSSTLHAVAAAAALRYAPEDLHLYVLDCAGGAQLPLAGFPHCGAVCDRQDLARGDRMLNRLAEEITRRQELLAASGFTSAAEQRTAVPAADRLPWILVLLDGWEGFTAAYEAIDHGRPVDTLLTVAREGGAVGIRVVATGGRPLLNGRVEPVLPTRILLRLGDANDYLMAGLPRRAVPDHMPEGRGLVLDGATEVQVALVGGTDQLAAVRAIAAGARRDANSVDPNRLPFRIRPLPQRIGTDELDPGPTARPLWTAIGVAGDAADTVGVDLSADGPGFLIAGPARSGRSTALLTMAYGLLAAGTAVAVIAPRRSPLRALAGTDGVIGCFELTDAEVLADAVAGPCAVVVDDLQTCTDSPVEPVLMALLQADDGRRALIGAGRSDELAMVFRGVAVAVRSSRAGLLLSPNRQDGDLLGARLPRVSGGQPPGRGVLVLAGAQTPVQVALPVPPRSRIGMAALQLRPAQGQPV